MLFSDVGEAERWALNLLEGRSMELSVVPPKETWLSTGATVLNLALSGDPRYGVVPGTYIYYVGDSSSGKTWFSLQLFAEASINSAYDGYDFIYDNGENGALMNLGDYFGHRMASRVKAPRYVDGVPTFSRTSEQLYHNLEKLQKTGKPFIYVQDSMDVLDTDYAQSKRAEKWVEIEGGAKAKGDYGDGKAKINSTHLRGVVQNLAKTGSILLLIGQTRDNIDAGLFDPKKTRAGGHALTFYATTEIWTSVGGRLKKTVKGNEVDVGATCVLAVKKNRMSGRRRTVRVPFYTEMGIDDVGANIDFLTTWDYWKVNKAGTVDAKDFGFAGRRAEVIAYIEANDLEGDLIELVSEHWEAVEEALKVGRKKRYE